MNNTAINTKKLNTPNKKVKLKKRKIKLSDWIKYDPRSKKEKAMILFKTGKNIKSIAMALKLDVNKLSKWIYNYYENIEENKIIEFPIKTKLTTPDNFSNWNSDNIYEFWNKLRKK